MYPDHTKKIEWNKDINNKAKQKIKRRFVFSVKIYSAVRQWKSVRAQFIWFIWTKTTTDSRALCESINCALLLALIALSAQYDEFNWPFLTQCHRLPTEPVSDSIYLVLKLSVAIEHWKGNHHYRSSAKIHAISTTKVNEIQIDRSYTNEHADCINNHTTFVHTKRNKLL